MIGLVLVSHGRLADEFLGALEHVMGAQDRAATVCIGPADDMEARRADIEAAIRATDAGDGVVVCTDMFGGTPSNLALAAMGSVSGGGPGSGMGSGVGSEAGSGGKGGAEGRERAAIAVEVLAGMNLPMLVKLAGVRAHKGLAECALIGQRAGRDYIKVASVMLGRRSRTGSGGEGDEGGTSGGDAR